MNTLFLENFGFSISKNCMQAELHMYYNSMYKNNIKYNFPALTVSAERISSLSFGKVASETTFVTNF